MKTVGLVVEYNPFHNGHLYHLTKAKEKTNADIVIAVMSGSFLQRGEPALVSKWLRTEMAISNGVDIVVELPYHDSVQKAESFAAGAIRILDHLFVDTVCFGSESGKIDDFYELYDFIEDHRKQWNLFLKEEIALGKSYPKATSDAFQRLSQQLGRPSLLSLSEPNNILGFHYVEATRKWTSSMTAETILRQKAHYHEQDITHATIASATSIRKALFSDQEQEKVKAVLPHPSYHILHQHMKNNQPLLQWESLFPYLQYQIISTKRENLADIYECEEGLEYRIQETIQQATSFQQWMELLKTKRYTWSRLQRLATHIFTQTTKAEIAELQQLKEPAYIRLLGMSPAGQAYLRTVKKKMTTPLISRFAEVDGIAGQLDQRVTTIYNMALGHLTHTNRFKEEYQQTPIRMKNES